MPKQTIHPDPYLYDRSCPCWPCAPFPFTDLMHYTDVTMSPMASQITSLGIVYSTVYSGADQRKHESSASLAFMRRIHRGPVNSPHKRPVTRKMFPFDDVIMEYPIVKPSLAGLKEEQHTRQHVHSSGCLAVTRLPKLSNYLIIPMHGSIFGNMT